MPRKKILIVMPAMLGGGAERILLNVLGRIDFSKFSIDLVLGVSKGDLLSQVPKEVKVVSLFSSTLFFRVVTWMQKRLKFNFFQYLIFNKKVKGEYDVGLCYLDGNMTDYLFHSNTIQKRIAWVHSSYVSNDNFAKFYRSRQYVNYLKNNRYGKLDKICFVSNDCKSEFEEVFGAYNNMEVIYNLINTDDILKKSKEQMKSDSEKFTFISIGSLIPVKGYDLLLKAVLRLKEKGYDFKVRIVGKGNKEAILKEFVKEKGLTKYVEFVGFTDNPYKFLKSSDAFVMTSISEANPTALCEALVLGKPAIVVNVPGCREIIGYGKYGILVERNVDDVANGMEQVLVEKGIRKKYEDKALERAKDFVDDAILEKYFKVLNF